MTDTDAITGGSTTGEVRLALAPIEAITPTFSGACATLSTGEVRCWGEDPWGCFATGLLNGCNCLVPQDCDAFSALGGTPTRIVSAARIGGPECAIIDGAVACWGSAAVASGSLGYPGITTIGCAETRMSIGPIDIGGQVVDLDVSESPSVLPSTHACALLAEGTVRCWGRNDYGQLGYTQAVAGPIVGDDETPASVGDVPIGMTASAVVTGGFHTCVILTDGTVRCWGDNAFGQLGLGHTEAIGDDETPASTGVLELPGAAAQLVAGRVHTCALLDTGTVRCWGAGSAGKLGYGNTEDIGDDETLSEVGDVDVGGAAVQLAAGSSHTCALLENGDLRCWGASGACSIGTQRCGALGTGSIEDVGDDEVPGDVDPIDVGVDIVAISAGGYQTCALTTMATARCWGSGAVFAHDGPEDDLLWPDWVIGDDESPSAAGDIPLLAKGCG